MAPQNSTLIHENYVSNTELSHYSPILPFTKNDGGHYKNIKNKSNMKHNYYNDEDDDHDGNDDDYDKNRNSIYVDGVQMKKSICSNVNNIQNDKNVINFTGEGEEEVEIPIWICGEPRYVSGVTTVTTCKDIIHALIDDEIQHENSTFDVAASRDINDYVITERWRDVEQTLSPDTNILPLWNAWGCAKNEVKFRLKINKTLCKKYVKLPPNEIKKTKPKKHKMNIITKLLRKVLHQGEIIQDHLSVISDKGIKDTKKWSKCVRQQYDKDYLMDSYLRDVTEAKYPSLMPKNKDEVYEAYKRHLNDSIVDEPQMLSVEDFNQRNDDDELFLVIENCDPNDSDSGVHIEYKGSICNEYIPQIKRQSYEIKETPKRKSKSKVDFEELRRRSLNRKLFNNSFLNADRLRNLENNVNDLGINTTNINNNISIRVDVINYEICNKMADIEQLMQREQDLLSKLAFKCAKYKAQNELYKTRLGIEIQIEKVQNNLEIYAKEIVEIQQELFQLKFKIEAQNRLVNELKKIVDVNNIDSNDICNTKKRLHLKLLNTSNLNFVDDIYEFCDYNKSMIV